MPFMWRHCRGNPAELLGFSLQPRYVSFWHKADMPLGLMNVRFRG
jgi:hypothetical protein